jgi:uncharacterized protein YdhG (YjbR/CyaY superfamily)
MVGIEARHGAVHQRRRVPRGNADRDARQAAAAQGTIRREAPDAVEKISYGIPTFTLHGNLVHFAGYEHHIGFYPGAAAIDHFADRLEGFETSKGTVRFPLDQPLPLELVREIVRFRVAAMS